MSNATYAGIDDAGLGTILIINVGVSLVILGIFSFLQSQPSKIPIYQPRTDPDLNASQAKHPRDPALQISLFPPLLRGYFSWICAPMKITDQQLLARSGLESLLYLKFQEYVIKCMMIVSMCSFILIFVNNTGTEIMEQAIRNGEPYHSGFPKWTLANINWHRESSQILSANMSQCQQIFRYGEGNPILWVHCMMLIIISIAFRSTIKKLEWLFNNARKSYMPKKSEQNDIADYSVMITNLPFELRDEKLLKNYIDKTFYPGKVAEVSLFFDTPKVWKLREKLSKLQKGIPMCSCCMNKERLKKRNNDKKKKIEEIQKLLLEEQGKENCPTTGYALVVFRDTISPRQMIQNFDRKFSPTKIDGYASPIYKRSKLQYVEDSMINADVVGKQFALTTINSAKQKIQNRDDHEIITIQQKLPSSTWSVSQAPDPGDIILSNLHFTQRSRDIYSFLMNILAWIIYLFWSFPVAILGSLESLSRIQVIGPVFEWILSLPEGIVNIIITYLPVLVISLFQVIVPYIFRWMSIHSGAIKESHVRKDVLLWYFSFLLFSGVIFPSGFIGTSRAMFELIRKIALCPIPQFLKVLTRVTTPPTGIYVAYLIQSIFIGSSVSLLRIGPLVSHSLRMQISTTKIDRQEIDNSAAKDFDFYLQYPAFLMGVAISLLFCITIPITTPIGLCYFLVKYYIDRYAISYVHPNPSIDSMGLMFARALKIFITMQGIFQLTSVATFLSRNAVPQAIIAAIFFWLTCRRYNSAQDHLAQIFREDQHIHKLSEENDPLFDSSLRSNENEMEIKTSVQERKLDSTIELNTTRVKRIISRQTEETERYHGNSIEHKS